MLHSTNARAQPVSAFSRHRFLRRADVGLWTVRTPYNWSRGCRRRRRRGGFFIYRFLRDLRPVAARPRCVDSYRWVPMIDNMYQACTRLPGAHFVRSCTMAMIGGSELVAIRQYFRPSSVSCEDTRRTHTTRGV
jgi:hypothetical protein